MEQAEANQLKIQIHALRAAILACLESGMSDSNPQVVSARHEQRLAAEALVKAGYAKGIGFDIREGDTNGPLKALAYGFDQKVVQPGPRELREGKPPAQIVRLRTLSFQSEAGELMHVDNPPPSQIVGLQSISMEGKVGALKGRPTSVLEGSIGIDYAVDKDPESGITFYVPI